MSAGQEFPPDDYFPWYARLGGWILEWLFGDSEEGPTDNKEGPTS